MSITLLVLVVLIPAVAAFAWWLAVLLEALRLPECQWQEAGQSRLLYVLLMVFLGIIGTIAYLVVARPQLRGPIST